MAPLAKDTRSEQHDTAQELTDRAFVLRKLGEFYYEDRPQPSLQSPRDVLVQIVATGLCGSDIHYWTHGRVGPYVVEKPLILGHESSGIVKAYGRDVKNLKVGDRVALEPGIACNTCTLCRGGKYNLCESMRFAATPPYDGTLSTHYVLPEECCFKLPHSISFEEGALVEPLSVAVHSCKLAGISLGTSLVVYGAGPIGLLSCAVGRALGATTIVAVDVVQSRLDFAKNYAATGSYKMEEQHIELTVEMARSNIGIPDGPEVVIDATGVASCINHGITAMRRGGTFVQVGLSAKKIDFAMMQICDKEITLKGSFRYGPGDYALAIELLQTGKVNLKELITHIHDFDDAEKAFETVLKREGIKSIIRGPNFTGQNPTNFIEIFG
ncbi:chlorophyll synthesis pathway protein BchC [Verruconis gallopava]|uniref:Chlorophyll synthesis pathway protein BchC n=1 Tax=Verruconis gallopava TaxID=253628 RepID=A0A0D1ZXZ1_9PEZI|nr:chlorophyll synthesis pathway protein BchC [Verruconis gallopava]KIV98949.1 chlorophyll synthesis pathway protein BchC [Verruconis gallopava]